MRIVLGVTGGIAAYKAAYLLRLLVESGHDVTVVATPAALRFVGEPTWAALSGRPVLTSLWEDPHTVPHVTIGQQTELVIVAPATADFLAKTASGLADDPLTNLLLIARCPIVLAPAMHTEMWEHPATQANVATLRERQIVVLEPAEGRLTGSDSGPGRLPEPEEIVRVAMRAASDAPGAAQDMAGLHLVITAGGTREPLDPVRFVGNRSSGRQGVALADAALARGARVTLIAANIEPGLVPSAMHRVVPVETTRQLHEAVVGSVTDADALIMAAAPADFAPASFAETKIKKAGEEGLTLALVQTPDILREVIELRDTGSVSKDLVVVGFAAETATNTAALEANAKEKLQRKGCDVIVGVNVSGGAAFGAYDVSALLLTAEGSVQEAPHVSKDALADMILNTVIEIRQGQAS